MRIGMFHNLGEGGALRCFKEYAERLSADHIVRQYTLGGRAMRARSCFQALRRYRQLASVIDSDGNDVVFVHPCSVFQAPPLLQYLTTPSLYYMQEPRRSSWEQLARVQRHAGYPRNPMLRLASDGLEHWFRRMDFKSARSATKVVANSYFSIEAITRVYGLDATLCPLGVDASVFAPSVGQVFANRIISVGALVPLKCHDFAIRTAAGVREADRPFVSIVSQWGSKVVQDELTDLARLECVRLEFHCALTDGELASLYSSSLAAVCAARLEPFGLTAIEAQACGTPVIAVQEGGYRETVTPGQSGFLVPREPIRAAAAVQELQQRPLSRVDIRAHVMRAWSWDASTSVVTAVMKSLKSGPGVVAPVRGSTRPTGEHGP